MKQEARKGFTIIEVILVLAVTGAVLVGLLAVQGNNLARRRYNDAVNSLQTFLQSKYDFGANIQNWRQGTDITLPDYACGNPDNAPAHAGRSGCVVYGIMFEFGQGDCDNHPNRRTGRCFVRYNWVVGLDYVRGTLFENESIHLGALNDLKSLALERLHD